MEIWNLSCGRTACGSVLAGAVAVILVSAAALAQNVAPKGPVPKVAPEESSTFGAIGRWFSDQADEIKATFTDARKRFDNFGHEAGVAARTTVNGAKEAADVMARLPNARVVSGHEKCRMAANGAPDCVSAAEAVCKTQGFAAGKSVDMTTAEVCPPKVWMSGRNDGEGCHTETFVSRALCQ